MPKITPFIWFENQAEEAMNFYTSIFKDSKVGNVTRMTGPDAQTTVQMASFELNGFPIIAMNGGPAGPNYEINGAISLFVDCKTQAEVDYYWDHLAAGGEILMCGWLKDKYGVHWQIIPDALPRLLTDPDPAKARRAVEAMLKMKKIVVADLEKAAKG